MKMKKSSAYLRIWKDFFDQHLLPMLRGHGYTVTQRRARTIVMKNSIKTIKYEFDPTTEGGDGLLKIDTGDQAESDMKAARIPLGFGMHNEEVAKCRLHNLERVLVDKDMIPGAADPIELVQSADCDAVDEIKALRKSVIGMERDIIRKHYDPAIDKICAEIREYFQRIHGVDINTSYRFVEPSDAKLHEKEHRYCIEVNLFEVSHVIYIKVSSLRQIVQGPNKRMVIYHREYENSSTNGKWYKTLAGVLHSIVHNHYENLHKFGLSYEMLRGMSEGEIKAVGAIKSF